MTDQENIQRLRETFYRGRFNEVLAHPNPYDLTEVNLIKANAFFEVHEVEKAKQVLSQSTDDDLWGRYITARVHYMDCEYEAALRIFQGILRESDDEHEKFRSLLGIGNVLFSTRQFSSMSKVVSQLLRYAKDVRTDEKISLDIFFGNYFMASGKDLDASARFFRKALSSSSRPCWNFFIQRSLHGLACVAKKQKNSAELTPLLGVLKAFLDESESLYFAHIVNEEFKDLDFVVKTPMEFDHHHRRVWLKDRWIAFHSKPLLFRFLEVLYESDQFVPKHAVAEALWPKEHYRPKLHDPRIFDIAKRVRKMIEAYESQPVVLLSGRSGYKLAHQ